MARIAKLAKPILKSLLITGAVVIVLSSPRGVIQIMRMVGKEMKRKKEREYFLWTLGYLRRKELVKFKEKDGKVFLELTEGGKKKALIYNLDTLTLPKGKKWDGKWRMIAFDIPERKREGRDALRLKLQGLGCVQLQKSLWVWPYECKDEVDFIAEIFEVGRYVHYFVVESLTSERFLLQKFGFPVSEIRGVS